ncbi:MAG: hypothetical protein ACXW1R_07130 [Halobacteriota archaeon]
MNVCSRRQIRRGCCRSPGGRRGVADERGPVSEGVADRLLDRVKLAVSRAADHPRGAISKTDVFETMNRAICYCTLADHADASMTGMLSFCLSYQILQGFIQDNHVIDDKIVDVVTAPTTWIARFDVQPVTYRSQLVTGFY